MLKFLFRSKFLGFVEAPVGVFCLMSNSNLPGWFEFGWAWAWAELSNKTNDSAQTLITPIFQLFHFIPMYSSLISKVLIYIVSYIFCFCEVIFESRIVLNYSIDPTNINIHYLFWIYCSMGLLETFPVCRVGGWVAGSIEIITNSAQLGLELGLSLAIMFSRLMKHFDLFISKPPLSFA